MSSVRVFYGGSFDPPHLGHRACVETLLSVMPQAKCVMVPSCVPPISSSQTKPVTVSFGDRYRMCELAFSDLIMSSRLLISDIENRLSAPNYTIQTIEVLKAQQGGQWWILIGQDQLKNLSNWYRVEDLVRQVHFFVIARELNAGLSELVYNLSKSLKLELEQDESGYILDGRSRIYLHENPLSEANSTEIRGDLKSHYNWLSEPVKVYISENNLYSICS